MVNGRVKRVLSIALFALLAFVGLGAWAVASPVGAAPDDDYHLASIWCAWGDREGLCAPGDNADERRIAYPLIATSACYAFDSDKSADCLIEDKVVSTNRGNFVGSYPPIFYATMGVFASENIEVSTVAMRLFNAALFISVVFTLFLMLESGKRGPLFWSIAVSMVPLGMFIVPSVNPSSWAVLSGATLWVALLGYFRSTSAGKRVGFGVLAIFLSVIGAGARGDSAAYVALTAVVVGVLSFEKSKIWLKRCVLPGLVVVIGAFFFLSSGQATGVSGLDGAQPSLSLGAALTSLVINTLRIQELWIGITGMWGLGWFDTGVPSLVWITLTMFFGALVFWGFQKMDIRKFLALGLVGTAAYVVPMYVLVREQLVVGIGIQPRYVMPLLIMFAGISILGLGRDHLRLTKLQAFLVLFAIALTNAISLYYNLRRYITGSDYKGLNLDSNIEWWWQAPVSPMAVWICGSGSFALLLLFFLVTLYQGERRGEPIADTKNLA